MFVELVRMTLLYLVVECVGEKCQVAVDTYIATTRLDLEQ
jgi:hypothetical protein